MKLITSINPNELQHNLRCLSSWCDAGFDVVSVNTDKEIGLLHDSFDFVTFISCSDTLNTNNKEYQRISNIIKLGALGIKPNEVVCLTNSDIECEISKSDIPILIEKAKEGLIFFSRTNYDTDKTHAIMEQWGFDTFMFNYDFANLLTNPEYCMGLPYWDYWFPYVFKHNNLPIYHVNTPVLFHKTHTIAWNQETWNICQKVFASEYIENTAIFIYNEIKHHSTELKPTINSDISIFNEADYLEANPDIEQAVLNGTVASGKVHYETYGKNEGRLLRTNTKRSLPYIKGIDSIFHERPIHKFPVFSYLEYERYFMERFIELSPKVNRKYLPIAWNAYYKNSNYDIGKVDILQNLINSLDRNIKYFTVSECAIVNDLSKLDIIVFSPFKQPNSKAVYIPMIYDIEPIAIAGTERNMLYSFIGALNSDIRLYVKSFDFPNVSLGEFDRIKYIHQLNRSKYTLIIKGKSDNNYRLFECLYCGSIPVFIAFDEQQNKLFGVDITAIGAYLDKKDIANIDNILLNLDEKALKANGQFIFDKYFTLDGCTNEIIEYLKTNELL